MKTLEKILSIRNSDDKTHKVITILGIKIKFKKRLKKSYALNSGERQTASKIENIRKDHINRYEKAVEMIKKYANSEKLKGLDIFCGNGYGSKYIVENLDTKLISIDGSKEAIECAKKYYADKNIKFENKLFPFKLKNNYYDFAVSLESIEHIEHDNLFLKKLVDALKENGILIISTPNNEKNNLEKNANHFHYRHYYNNEFIKLAKSLGFELLETFGQDTYVINKVGIVEGVLNPKDMDVKKDYNGQFTIFILKKQ